MTEDEQGMKELMLSAIGNLYIAHVVSSKTIAELHRLLALANKEKHGDPAPPAPQV